MSLVRHLSMLALPCLFTTGAAAAPTTARPIGATGEIACAAPVAATGAQCGDLVVPENRARRSGRRITLRYAVLPGTRSDVAPLYLLAGGPGQSAIEQAPAFAATLRSVHAGDIVLLDQRGTGGSHPLTCPGGFSILRRDGASAVADCRARLSRDADLRFYTTVDAVADLDALRGALGHERIDLLGISYGTRVAAAYMRRYEPRVRSALLRAVAPPGLNIIVDGSRGADAEMAKVALDCRADAACAADFPDVAGMLAAIRARLKTAPERIRTPDGAELVVTSELFNSVLYVLLLTVPTRQALPRLLAQIDAVGFQPSAPLIAQVRTAVYGQIPVGMYLSVVCAEDAPRIARADAAGGGGGFARDIPMLAALCRAWPRRPAAREDIAPLGVSTPVLLMSGANDPSTTAAGARRFAATLEAATHIVLPATAHAPPIPACAIPAVAGFFQAPAHAVDTHACDGLTLPPFARPATR